MTTIRLQGDAHSARSISDVMGSISEVLITSEELLEDGDSDREVAILVTSFLKTLLVQLDEVLVSQDGRPFSEGTTSEGATRKTKRPMVNKYDARCSRCNTPITAGQGYVLPAADPNARKKWHAFCDTCYER